MKINIIWLADSHECETCGTSFAQGARVYKDDELWIELEPHAHCFESKDYDCNEVYKRILRELGHEVHD